MGLSETLHRIRSATETLAQSTRPMGFLDQPPGRYPVVFMHYKDDGSLWHTWNGEEGTHEPIWKRAVRGVIEDAYAKDAVNEKHGKSVKLRIDLDTGDDGYILQATLSATVGRSLLASLRAADRETLSGPVTITVKPGEDVETTNVVLTDMYAGGEPVLTESEDWPPKGDMDRTLTLLQRVRQRMGWGDTAYREGDDETAYYPADDEDEAPRGPSGDGAPADAQSAAQSERRPDTSQRTGTKENGANGAAQAAQDDTHTSGEGISRDEQLQLWNTAKRSGYDKSEFVQMIADLFGVSADEAHPSKITEDHFGYVLAFARNRKAWRVINAAFRNGYDRAQLGHMLDLEFGVDNPAQIQDQDRLDKALSLAQNKDIWEKRQESFDDELPF